jgi:hypothetical protein
MSRVMSRGGDVFVCDYDTRVRLLARNNTPLDAERQRGLLGDRNFPRGDSIKDSEGRIQISSLLHARFTHHNVATLLHALLYIDEGMLSLPSGCQDAPRAAGGPLWPEAPGSFPHGGAHG